MKVLKTIASGVGKILDFGGAIIAVGLLLMVLSGMITFGCSKSFWINQTTCTMTMIFNSLK